MFPTPRNQILIGTRSAAALILASIAACDAQRVSESTESASPAQPEKSLLVLVGIDVADPMWAAIVSGARAEIAHNDIFDLNVVVPDEASSLDANRLVDRALADAPRAVLFYNDDSPAAKRITDLLLRRGPILVTMSSGDPVTAAYGHVRIDLAEAAGLLGEHLRELAAGRRGYALIHRRSHSRNDKLRYQSFMAAAGSPPGLTLLKQLDLALEDGDARAAIASVFDEFPSTLLIVSLEETPWCNLDWREVLPPDAQFATIGTAHAALGTRSARVAHAGSPDPAQAKSAARRSSSRSTRSPKAAHPAPCASPAQPSSTRPVSTPSPNATPRTPACQSKRSNPARQRPLRRPPRSSPPQPTSDARPKRPAFGSVGALRPH